MKGKEVMKMTDGMRLLAAGAVLATVLGAHVVLMEKINSSREVLAAVREDMTTPTLRERDGMRVEDIPWTERCEIARWNADAWTAERLGCPKGEGEEE